MELQAMKDEIAAKMKAYYAAVSEERRTTGLAITAFTGEPMPDESQEVAALTSEVKTSVDDIEASVRDSQQP